MIGIVSKDNGIIIEKKNLRIAKRIMTTDNEIPSHNHPNFTITFIIIKGEIEITLDDTEKHLLSQGDVLTFDGSHYIYAKPCNKVEFIRILSEN